MGRDEGLPPVLDDVAAHERAMSLPIAEVVEELVDFLGLTTVAAIGGVGETRAVQQWMTGREPQRPNVLRFALQVVTMISTIEDKSIVGSWFQGCNPALGDRIPAVMLRNEPLQDIQGPLLSAARAFAGR
jgi:hypothetical protein